MLSKTRVDPDSCNIYSLARETDSDEIISEISCSLNKLLVSVLVGEALHVS